MAGLRGAGRRCPPVDAARRGCPPDRDVRRAGTSAGQGRPPDRDVRRAGTSAGQGRSPVRDVRRSGTSAGPGRRPAAPGRPISPWSAAFRIAAGQACVGSLPGGPGPRRRIFGHWAPGAPSATRARRRGRTSSFPSSGRKPMSTMCRSITSPIAASKRGDVAPLHPVPATRVEHALELLHHERHVAATAEHRADHPGQRHRPGIVFHVLGIDEHLERPAPAVLDDVVDGQVDRVVAVRPFQLCRSCRAAPAAGRAAGSCRPRPQGLPPPSEAARRRRATSAPRSAARHRRSGRGPRSPARRPYPGRRRTPGARPRSLP